MEDWDSLKVSSVETLDGILCMHLLPFPYLGVITITAIGSLDFLHTVVSQTL